MRCFCFPSIFENSHFWKQKFVIFIIFLEMFQNPKSWCFLFQPQFRNVLKATNNSLYPFFQDFPEFEVLEINKFLFSLANLKFSFFLQISNLEIPFYRIPILPGKISKPLSFRLEIESHFTEIPFYREHTVHPNPLMKMDDIIARRAYCVERLQKSMCVRASVPSVRAVRACRPKIKKIWDFPNNLI